MSAKKVNSTMLRDALDVFFLVSAEILVFVLLDYFQIVLTLPAVISVAISTVVFVALCLLLLPDKSEETSLHIAGRDSGSEVSSRSSLSLDSRKSSENTRKTRVSNIISEKNTAAAGGSEVSLFLDGDVEQELKRMDVFSFAGYIEEDGKRYPKEAARGQHQQDINRMKVEIDVSGQDSEARKVGEKNLLPLISNGSDSLELFLGWDKEEEITPDYSQAANTWLINSGLNNEKLTNYFQDALSQTCIIGSALMTYLGTSVNKVKSLAGDSSVNVRQRTIIKPLTGDTVDVTIKIFLVESEKEHEIGSITAELNLESYSTKGVPILLKYKHNFSQKTFKSQLRSFYYGYEKFDHDFDQACKEVLNRVWEARFKNHPNQDNARQILKAIDPDTHRVHSENAVALSHGLYRPVAIVQESDVGPRNATQASTP